MFTIDGIRFFPGWHNPETNWNGFAVPYFSKEVSRDILNYHCEDRWGYNETATMFWVENEGGDLVGEYEVVQWIDERPVYSIGGFEWTWQSKTN